MLEPMGLPNAKYISGGLESRHERTFLRGVGYGEDNVNHRLGGKTRHRC